MAWLAGDGFDFYASVTDAANNIGVWSSITACTLNTTSANSRFGTGNFMLLGNNSLTAGNMATVVFANSTTIYVNLNILTNQAHVNGGTTQVLGFTWRDGSTIQGGFFLRNGGDFVVTSGGIGTSVLATSSVLMPNAGTWAHIQVKIVVNNTTGSVEMRLNGATSASFLASSLNTRNGTSNFYGTTVNFTSSSANADFCDDCYVFNDQGAAPNTWQGDVHAVQQMPTTDSSIQWTRNTGPNNCLCVDDPRQDADTTYVATNGVNNVDIYALNPLATTPASIIAVVVKYVARMDDAGPHTVNASMTSGGTTVTLSNYICTNAYTYRQETFALDPNTSAAWSAAAVNALLLSIKDVL